MFIVFRLVDSPIPNCGLVQENSILYSQSYLAKDRQLMFIACTRDAYNLVIQCV